MLRKIVLLTCAVIISGCSFQETVPYSVANAYPDTPVNSKIRGSSSQKIIKRSYGFSRADVLEAVNTSILRLGLNKESDNIKVGKVVASGQIVVRSDGATWPFSLAFYVKQISSRPETQLTIIIDRYKSGLGWEPNDAALNKTTKTIQQILSTY